MQGQLPILVFAQSARFIAESATQAGFTVWVADCFCDVDTILCSRRHRQLPPLSELDFAAFVQHLTILANGENCLLICGTGIEKFYPAIKQLPDNISLVGNPTTLIESLKQADLFFSLLIQLGLNFPQTEFSPPKDALDTWLVKQTNGFGGTHISYFSETIENQSDIYYQRYINGISGSACFISNGEQSKLLSVNQLFHASTDFELTALASPLNVPPELHHQLEAAVALLCKQTALKGVNSLDFIATETNIFLLEINPRISASAELLAIDDLFDWHLQACQGKVLNNFCPPENHSTHLLSYILAEQEIAIPHDVDWPNECHDIPNAGTIILAKAPICTLKITASSLEDCFETRDLIAAQLTQKLSAFS